MKLLSRGSLTKKFTLSVHAASGGAKDALAKLRSYAQMGIGHINITFQPFGSECSNIAALSGIAAKLA